MKTRIFMLFAFFALLPYACTNEQAPTKSVPTHKVNQPGPKKVNDKLTDPALDDSTAADWTKRWRDNGRDYIGDLGNELPLAFVTGREDFQKILTEKPGADSIRAYLAIDDTGTLHLVYVGVDGSGEDLTGGGDDAIYDLTFVCPPVCDTSSILCNCPFTQ